jgi:hypothetical protein
MSLRSPYSAERHLETFLRIQRETLERRGIDLEIIAEQCRDMEVAIRCQLTQVNWDGDAA